jgi:hypothetical protein
MKRMAFLAALLLPLPALAQANRVYEASATVPTNIAGVRTFPEAPPSFDPVRASDIDLARYGLPPRPHDADALAHWTAAMAMGARQSHELIRKMPWHIGPAIREHAGVNETARTGTNGTTLTQSLIWSGQVDSIPGLNAYDPAHSFSFVSALMTVPLARSALEMPLGAGPGSLCNNTSVSGAGWVGFDGFPQGNDVLQGGWAASFFCAVDNESETYCLWGAWYPTTGTPLCQYTAQPGDVIFRRGIANVRYAGLHLYPRFNAEYVSVDRHHVLGTPPVPQRKFGRLYHRAAG